jgi:cell division protein FtsN
VSQRQLKHQRGGFFMGLMVGLVIGLALAFTVTILTSKVPMPFVNKVPQRTAEQDAAEVEKNKAWDPNSSLYGKNPIKPNAGASGAALVVGPPAPDAPASGSSGTTQRPAKPADLLVSNSASAPAAPKSVSPAPSTYFIQAGAYSNASDAEQQLGKLALLGHTAKVTEREQGGRMVYRVRIGPFSERDEADSTKEMLGGAGVNADLIQIKK